MKVGFDRPQKALSWAVRRPGYQRTTRVAWLQVKNADLPVGVDAADLVAARAAANGLEDAIVLMTSASLERHHVSVVDCEGVRATCLMTLGLSNAERIGSRRRQGSTVTVNDCRAAIGTINALCHVSVPLTDPAMAEAVSVATQARTTAILSYQYERTAGGGVVTGTGTDCIVVACPSHGMQHQFCGLHTPTGEALGASVLNATHVAMDDWLHRNIGPDGKPDDQHRPRTL